MNKKTLLALAGAALVATPFVAAEQLIQAEQSGFLSDYSQLEKADDGTADYRFTVDDLDERIANYNALMIDQPEIFIAADSPYGGAKPKHLDALADSLRRGMAVGFSDEYYIVDQAGPNVVYVAVALSNLRLTKRKKSVLAYTPIGLVTGAVVGAANTDIAKKANLQDVIIEFEMFDSVTGERLAALITHRGEGAESPSSWEELDRAFLNYGQLAACRWDNARAPAEERVDCFAEFVERRREAEAAEE